MAAPFVVVNVKYRRLYFMVFKLDASYALLKKNTKTIR